MTDPRPAHTCTTCGYDAGSKFALKRHLRHCTNGLPSSTIRHVESTAPFVQDQRGNVIVRDSINGDRYALATRETKYHRFVP